VQFRIFISFTQYLKSTKNNKQKKVAKNSKDYYVGFEVFTAMIMKSIIFWDVVTPCSLLDAADVLEEHIASSFRVEENFSKDQQVSRWQAE
jgi:hypothetical protein